MTESKPTQTKFGKFTLLDLLNAGGMSEVFKANVVGPEGFTRTVALKRILPHVSHDPAFVEMFIDEAKISSQLHHPNICNIYSFGRIEMSYFLAMEYISGQSLREIIKAFSERQELMPLPIALHIIQNLCDALDYAHTLTDQDGKFLQIVHRDIKPSNILISYLGAVKLIDFGIARAKGRLSITNGSFRKGTWSYMAPEQTGDNPIDHRTDVFGLGLVLYELLTGKSVYPKISTTDLLELVKAAKIDPPSSINPQIDKGLDEITMRALAPRPEDRYTDMREMEKALHDYEEQMELRCTQRDLTSMMESQFSAELAGEKEGLPLPPKPPKEKGEGADPEDTQRYADPPASYFEDAHSAPVESSETTQGVEGAFQEGSGPMIQSPPPSKKGIQPWVILLGGTLLLLVGVVIGVFFWKKSSPPPVVTPVSDPVAEKPAASPSSPDNQVPLETTFEVTSKPPGATVTVLYNNREVPLSKATTPTSVPGIQEGERYLIRISREGYVTTERETRWKAGDPSTINFQLVALPKSAVAPAPVAVEPQRQRKQRGRRVAKRPRGKRLDPVDPKPVADLPGADDPLTANPEPPTPKPAPKTVKVEPPRVVQPKVSTPAPSVPKARPPKKVTPAPTVGKLFVVSKIPGYVFINSKNTGKLTPATFSLPPGKYEIVVVLRQSNTRIKHNVTVQAGKSYRVRFKGAK